MKNVAGTWNAGSPALKPFAEKGMDAVFSKFNLDSDEVVETPQAEVYTCQLIHGIDTQNAHVTGVPQEAVERQKQAESYFGKRGVAMFNTCTPYQVGNVPVRGEHCAWMESSAVVYCNGVLGARTNTEGRESTGAASITGKIPYWGFHIEENRRGTHLVEVEVEVDDMMEWGLLGYAVGEVVEESVGLVGRNSGKDIATTLEGGVAATTQVLNLRAQKQIFRLAGVNEAAVPSIGRGFSAPVKFETGLSSEDRAFLMAKDSDPFNRWESGQKFATELLVRMSQDASAGRAPKVDQLFVDAFGEVLRDARKDPAFTALATQLPAEMELAQVIDNADPEAIHTARETLRKALATAHKAPLRELYQSLNSNEPYSPDAAPSGRRALRSMCLRYLTAHDTGETRAMAFEHFRSSNNMTDKIGGLAPLVDMSGDERNQALQQFYEHSKANPLVIDKWMSLQASSCRGDTLEQVNALTKHPAFNIENPNRVRSLIGPFVMNNQLRFHAADGSGYRFLADYVLTLDGLNPQVAARLCGAFETWRRFDNKRQTLIRDQLMRINKANGLSRNVLEITEKTLG